MPSIPINLESENPAIRTSSLAKSFRSNRALAGLDLTVPEGAFYLLVGPNGSGKTTTMRILLDLVRPDSGEVEVFSLPPGSRGALVRAQIGYVPEGSVTGYEWMRVGRLLEHHSSYFPSWDVKYAQSLVEALDIDLARRLKKLSKGETRRIQLVMALTHRPPLLLLDEPMDGLDPLIRDRVIEILVAHLSETPSTVLASTHHIQELEKLADHMGVLFEGRLLSQNSREELHRTLRRYMLEVPREWSGAPELNDAIVHRNGSGPEIAWAVWGDPEQVSHKLKDSGATVRNVTALRLEEAALAILAGKEAE